MTNCLVNFIRIYNYLDKGENGDAGYFYFRE